MLEHALVGVGSKVLLSQPVPTDIADFMVLISI
jgi:hypothetical protein